ncbi:Uncharacterised protein [Halioglobus japonicus]|nr:Uncharacterised protein [Halioglobus japonicus]
MTRECATDFERLESYLGNFSLSQNLCDPNYLASIKLMHKCYFSVLSWNAELIHRKEVFLESEARCSDDIILRISEAVSDLGSSFFNWSSGNYKASRIMLRVSIENFLRALGGIEESGLLTEKNVFTLMQTALKLDIFKKTPFVQKCVSQLRGDYGLLCMDAHTATSQNMEQLTSLADIPMFDTVRAKACSDIFMRISKNMTVIFCILFDTFFRSMHHRNRDNVLNGLDKPLKRAVFAT